MLSDSYISKLKDRPYTWLVTGAAGFIGSHILEELLKNGQNVIGLENFATGKIRNLDEVRSVVGKEAWSRFRLIEGDIRDTEECRAAAKSCDFILHQAALGSVPLSVERPELTHDVNERGFLNILMAARDTAVKRVIYASSCAVYGNNPSLPLIESDKHMPQSPYAASKICNEIYARTFQNTYGLQSVGLRYFNVFGERQDPDGAYAAVIPKWIDAAIKGSSIFVDGDGLQTRDFVYVKNVARANIALAVSEVIPHFQCLNVGSGEQTSLLQVLQNIEDCLLCHNFINKKPVVEFRKARIGDIRHSYADTTELSRLNLFDWTSAAEGMSSTILWFAQINALVSGSNSALPKASEISL